MRVFVWKLGSLTFLAAYLELNFKMLKFVLLRTVISHLPLPDN